MKQGIRRADGILVGGLLLAGVILGVILWVTMGRGARVEVRVSGEVVETFSLEEDREYIIEGRDGGTNALTIRNGEAWLTEADCPDHLCVHMGKISQNGQSIICLPHQVVVEVVGETTGETEAVDAVAGGKQ